MRTALFVIGIASLLGSGIAAQKQDSARAASLKVSGMSCEICAATVEKAAKEIEGVIAVSVSHKKGTADVTYDSGKASPESIAKALNAKTPFKATAPAQKQ
jgi:copper chaperone CopZ